MSLPLAIGLLPGGLLLWILAWIAFTHLRFHTYHRAQRRPYPPLGWSGWLVFYLRTLGSVGRLLWWWLRASFSNGLRMPAGAPTGPPVLCVHGFHMNGSCMWGLRRTLEGAGRPTRALFLGLPYRSPEIYARSLTAVLRDLLAEVPDRPIDVVAHSMGGLILRLVLSREPALAARIGGVVTLGTPHHGTAFLRWFRFGPAYRLMSPDCEFIRKLPPLAASAPHARVTTFASAHDLVVYPVETAHLAGARAITLERVGHAGLLTERSVHRRVAAALDHRAGLEGASPRLEENRGKPGASSPT